MQMTANKSKGPLHVSDDPPHTSGKSDKCAVAEGTFGGADDDDDLIRMDASHTTIDADIQWLSGVMRVFCWLVILALCIVLVLIGFTLIYMTGEWAIHELDAVSEVYSVDCNDMRCSRPTYNTKQSAIKMPPCARLSAFRCSMIPVNWIFQPMLPVYQYVTKRNLWKIQQELPLLLAERCKLCFGVAHVRQ